MGVRAIMVDQARTSRLSAQPRVVDGTTVMSPIMSDWFRVRLELPSAAPEDQPTGYSRRVVKVPTLYCLPDGNGDCPVRADETLDIDSANLGAARYRVVSAPRPWRKKRRVIGYEVSLERIDELDNDSRSAA